MCTHSNNMSFPNRCLMCFKLVNCTNSTTYYAMARFNDDMSGILRRWERCTCLARCTALSVQPCLWYSRVNNKLCFFSFHTSGAMTSACHHFRPPRWFAELSLHPLIIVMFMISIAQWFIKILNNCVVFFIDRPNLQAIIATIYVLHSYV